MIEHFLDLIAIKTFTDAICAGGVLFGIAGMAIIVRDLLRLPDYDDSDGWGAG